MRLGSPNRCDTDGIMRMRLSKYAKTMTNGQWSLAIIPSDELVIRKK